MGKTEWARSHGPHIYFGEQFNQDVALHADEGGYAVFDDCQLKFIVNWKGWLGQQKEFTCTDKYKGKKLIKWGKPVIWCTNEDPRGEFGIKDHEVEWLGKNCLFVYVEEPLFLMPVETGSTV